MLASGHTGIVPRLRTGKRLMNWLLYWSVKDFALLDWLFMMAIMVSFIIAAIEVFDMIFGRSDWR